MQLRDRGLLSLDDPVVKYVPELALAHDPFGNIADIKIRHLMSHSAGFRAATWPWGGDQPWHPVRADQLGAAGRDDAVHGRAVRAGLEVQLLESRRGLPRANHRALSGDDYEVYVTKNILMPLGMRSRSSIARPTTCCRTVRIRYFRDGDGIKEARFDFDTGITVSNGGLNAPFDDMARYLAFLIGDRRAQAEYDVVLKRSSLEEMWTPQIRAAEGEGTNGADSQAALSFFVERYGAVQLIGHSGDQNGFISHLYLHLPSKTAYLVSFNTDTTPRRAASPREPARSTRRCAS